MNPIIVRAVPSQRCLASREHASREIGQVFPGTWMQWYNLEHCLLPIQRVLSHNNFSLGPTCRFPFLLRIGRSQQSCCHRGCDRSSRFGMAGLNGALPSGLLLESVRYIRSSLLDCDTWDPIRRPNNGLLGGHNRITSREYATDFWIGRGELPS